jgi:hypothetical protein
LSHFLGRINTGGRDFRDLTLFKAGEKFLPVGPPKGKPPKFYVLQNLTIDLGRKNQGKDKLPPKDAVAAEDAIETLLEIEHPSSSRIRKRSSKDLSAEDGLSSKKLRLTLQTFSSKPNILLPGADSPAKSKLPVDLAPESDSTRSRSLPLVAPAEQEIMDDLFNFSNTVPMEIPAPPPSTSNAEPHMPLHRARIVNPLVQQLPDEDVAKLQSHDAKIFKYKSKPAEPLPPPRRRKPGPGRSSGGLLFQPSTLLTADKGKLKSIKGKRKNGKNFTGTSNEAEDFVLGRDIEPSSGMFMDRDVPTEPPKPEELLQLAGLEPISDGLPEYEEVGMEPLSAEKDAQQHTK